MNKYLKGFRRILIDMHIGDWNSKFLSKYDPKKIVDLYKKARLNSVMFYAQSHVGLCYWPTRSGKMHAGLKGRDIVGETLSELKKAGINSCVYYSLLFNNWAFLKNPGWRVKLLKGRKFRRYGLCCPNSKEYGKFVLKQVDELLTGYEFDVFFFDMPFWEEVCVCKNCRKKFKKETGKNIPHKTDWLDPNWVKYQEFREKAIMDLVKLVSERVRAKKPEMLIYFNYAAAFENWNRGLSFESRKYQDFLGGDFYGAPIEQLFVCKAMINLTKAKPVEFMTSCCINLLDHTALKKYPEMEMQAFAATLFSAAFMFIDAINADGTINPFNFNRIGKIFKKTLVYEPFLGGEPVEDIAIYFSDGSKMDFKDADIPLEKADFAHYYPHRDAATGMVRILQKEHLPFGIITKKQIKELNKYKVVVLPNLLRMTEEELEAFKAYVKEGGRLYASKYTSLTGSDGKRYKDFRLADVFGCSFLKKVPVNVAYLKPAAKKISACFYPQKYISHNSLSTRKDLETLFLKEKPAGETLATLTLNYGSPNPGTVFDKKWSSIHSTPPWKDLKNPVIVKNKYFKGTAVFSAADIETSDNEANYRLVTKLIRGLLKGTPSYTAETNPDVWMTVFDQKENNRLLIGFLNYQKTLPAVPVREIPFSVKPPEGKKFKQLLLLPGKTKIKFRNGRNGIMHAKIENLETIRMFIAEYR